MKCRKYYKKNVNKHFLIRLTVFTNIGKNRIAKTSDENQ